MIKLSSKFQKFWYRIDEIGPIFTPILENFENTGMPTGTDFPYFVRKICANTEIRFMPFRVRITKKKKKKKRLQKEIMTGADKLIGGNSNITLYYFHGRANVVNLM